MMVAILNIIMYEDCRNQWSMSRPLLPLLLLNEEVCLNVSHHASQELGVTSTSSSPHPQYFQTFRSNVISVQLPVKQQAMAGCFDSLMDGIEYNLLQKNRDRWGGHSDSCGMAGASR